MQTRNVTQRVKRKHFQDIWQYWRHHRRFVMIVQEKNKCFNEINPTHTLNDWWWIFSVSLNLKWRQRMVWRRFLREKLVGLHVVLHFDRNFQLSAVATKLIGVFVVCRPAVDHQQRADVQRRLVVEPVIIQRNTWKRQRNVLRLNRLVARGQTHLNSSKKMKTTAGCRYQKKFAFLLWKQLWTHVNTEPYLPTLRNRARSITKGTFCPERKVFVSFVTWRRHALL